MKPLDADTVEACAQNLQKWAKVFRHTPIPADPLGEFLPVDLDEAARMLRSLPTTTPALGETEVVERARDEFYEWFERCALNLQASAPDGRNPAGYKGPHPCECADFAEDACARVAKFASNLLASPFPLLA